MIENQIILNKRLGRYKATELFRATLISDNFYSRFINRFLKNNPYVQEGEDWECIGAENNKRGRGRRRQDYWINEDLCLSICDHIINTNRHATKTKLECRKIKKLIKDNQQHG